jgi:maltokinase
MIDAADLPPVLIEHLPTHVPRQRWSGAHDRAIAAVELRWHEVIRAGDPMLVWTLARVRFDDGVEQDYQLFLGIRSEADLPDFLHGKDRELVARLVDPPHAVVIYDALIDPDLAIEVLHLVAPDIEVTVRRPIVLEHSNSSVVFDEAHILKVFRKVEPGPNPDVEITHVLAAIGYPNVLPPLAELRRDGIDLAVLREFLVGSTEGWELARASVRDMLAGGLPPDESGADFAPDAERLGAVLAGLHVAMADAWERSPGDPARWGAEMEATLKEIEALAGADDVPAPALDAAAVAERFHALAELKDAGQEIRIHGDLHLAQVIKTDAGWKILDFEGEPARRRDDRFTTSSPLRDIAGILRSLHYVAAAGLAEWGDDDPHLVDLVDQWEQRNRAALLDSYLGTETVAHLLPVDEEARDALLAAFELDKAVYEVGYELGHRPDHVHIPLVGIARLLSSSEAELPRRAAT